MKALAAVLAAASGAAFAAPQTERVLESSRAQGRGNTYVAATESDEATRTNPATLAESNVKFQVRWLQLDLLPGENAVKFVQNLSELDGDSSAVGILQDVGDTALGKQLYLRGQLSPLAIRILSFEIAPFLSTVNAFDARIPPTPTISIYSSTMFGLNLSLGLELAKTLTAGITVRPAQRVYFQGDVAFSDLMSFIEDDDFELKDVIDEREGLVVGADLGFIWKPAKEWRFGLLGENVGYASTTSKSDEAPPPYPQRISLGGHYRVDWKPWFWDFSLDLQNLTEEKLHFLRMLHLGTEIGRTYFTRDTDVGLLGGVNEGYFTIGGYLDILLARLTASYYAVELGEYPGQRKDRRWAISVLVASTF